MKAAVVVIIRGDILALCWEYKEFKVDIKFRFPIGDEM